MESEKRIVWLDWMRVLACFMVMVVHCTEPYYLGGEGSRILTESDAWWSSFFDSFVRACVPLFVVASSYLLFPLHHPTGVFFKKRVVRVIIPFVIWSVIYALVWGEPVQNFKDLLLNFNYAAGHLWFIYMILGLYLIMPLLSPWAEKVGRKELGVYLGIWLFTTLIPIIRSWAGGPDTPTIYGPSGIPMPAKYPLWGEASWNSFGLFYYISGFIGYLLLGLYLKKFVGELSWGRTIAVGLPCWIAGFAICFGGFLRRVYESCGGSFPIEGPVGIAALWETTWFNDTIGVALMTLGWVLLFRKFNRSRRFFDKVVAPLSKASYGMYLGHMIVLAFFASLFKGMFATPVNILLSAVCTFICVGVAAVVIRKIPKIGKLIIG